MLATLTAVTSVRPVITHLYDRRSSRAPRGFNHRLRHTAASTRITAVTPGKRTSFESGSTLDQSQTNDDTSNHPLTGALNHRASDIVRRRPYS